MSAAVSAPARPASPADVVALQYGNPYRMLGVPLIILGAVVALTVAVSLIVLRAGGDPGRADFNASVLYSVLGYTVALGVQNVSSSFPFALALGSTRRAFVLGNLATAVVQALIVAALSVALLGVEVVTRGWFVGTATFGSVLLGDGDPLVLGGVVFATMLGALSVGSVFGASWIRFGARGPLALSLVGAVVLAVLLLLLVPQLGAITAAFRPWWIAVGIAGVIGLATVGEYLSLRRASVR
ncbi:hypothetical protein [Amnibacterium endophyticum]|uniref:ABC transporter permease n=1 Tax=Amnibacterium endophyticum TaxID=2109337 RepID=A0ABW4L9T2_9MICO